MGNYTSCKIYLEKKAGELDLDWIRNQVSRLKEENKIYQTIEVFVCLQNSTLEIRFGTKWYPSMIDEIFLPEDYSIWIIGSDEGGASDYLRHYPSETSLIEETAEKALYKFDEIELQGDLEKINRNLEAIFGWGINHYGFRKSKDNTLNIRLSGMYKSNNYFCNPDEGEIVFKFVESLPFRDKPNDRTEFWEFIWETDGIDFRDKFYKETLGVPNGKTAFDYLDFIRFRYNGELTNEFNWNGNRWEHTAVNDFYNCINANFQVFQTLRKLIK